MRRPLITTVLGSLAFALFCTSALMTQSATAAGSSGVAPLFRTPVWGTATALAPHGAPPSPISCTTRLYDDLRQLVIFKCSNDDLAFYRSQNAGWRFHAWLSSAEWSQPAPGLKVMDETDDQGYRITFWQLAAEEVQAAKLPWPSDRRSKWYKVGVFMPDGTLAVRAFVLVTP